MCHRLTVRRDANFILTSAIDQDPFLYPLVKNQEYKLILTPEASELEFLVNEVCEEVKHGDNFSLLYFSSILAPSEAQY